MPQMAPLNWLILFILFLTLFMSSSVKLYFSNSQQIESNINLNGKMSPVNMNWKW